MSLENISRREVLKGGLKLSGYAMGGIALWKLIEMVYGDLLDPLDIDNRLYERIIPQELKEGLPPVVAKLHLGDRPFTAYIPETEESELLIMNLFGPNIQPKDITATLGSRSVWGMNIGDTTKITNRPDSEDPTKYQTEILKDAHLNILSIIPDPDRDRLLMLAYTLIPSLDDLVRATDEHSMINIKAKHIALILKASDIDQNIFPDLYGSKKLTYTDELLLAISQRMSSRKWDSLFNNEATSCSNDQLAPATGISINVGRRSALSNHIEKNNLPTIGLRMINELYGESNILAYNNQENIIEIPEGVHLKVTKIDSFFGGETLAQCVITGRYNCSPMIADNPGSDQLVGQIIYVKPENVLIPPKDYKPQQTQEPSEIMKEYKVRFPESTPTQELKSQPTITPENTSLPPSSTPTPSPVEQVPQPSATQSPEQFLTERAKTPTGTPIIIPAQHGPTDRQIKTFLERAVKTILGTGSAYLVIKKVWDKVTDITPLPRKAKLQKAKKTKKIT